MEIRRDGIGIYVGDQDRGPSSVPVRVKKEVVNVGLHQEGRSGVVRHWTVVSDELTTVNEQVWCRKAERRSVKLQHVGPQDLEVGDVVPAFGRSIPREGVVASTARHDINSEHTIKDVIAIPAGKSVAAIPTIERVVAVAAVEGVVAAPAVKRVVP